MRDSSVSSLGGGPPLLAPATVNYLFIDVRDLALAHVLALEKREAENQRVLATVGNYSNAEIAQIIGKEYLEFKEKMSISEALKSGERPATGVNGYDNSKRIEILGLQPLNESIVGVVESIKGML